MGGWSSEAASLTWGWVARDWSERESGGGKLRRELGPSEVSRL
ncbi:hypothetical protein [Paenibacillus oceani]|nr:hypothetical protein [Paenibacillus oceani]